jgi:hypothetical protein
MRCKYRVLVGLPEERRPLGIPRVIVKWIFKKRDGGMGWIDLA